MSGSSTVFSRGENPLRADKLNTAFSERVLRLGDTMQGPLALVGNPTTALHAVPKQYVDSLLTAQPALDFVNVKHFGAVGDGVTDDTQAIRNAIDSLGGLGGVVYFPAGNYRVSGGVIVVPSGTRITGAGPNISTIWPYVPDTSGMSRVFCNPNFITYGLQPGIQTTPDLQTDHDYVFDNIGFNFGTATDKEVAAVTLEFAQQITFNNVTIYKSSPAGPNYANGFQLLGCDRATVSHCRMFNVQNAVDCWQGTTSVKIDNCVFVSAFAGTNGGLINFNGYYNTNNDLQVSNTTLWVNHATGINVDPLVNTSVTTNVLIENVLISARADIANIGIMCQGSVNRLKVRGVSFEAITGADMQPIVVRGFYSQTAETTTGKVETRAAPNASLITATYPVPCRIGVGNYMQISLTAGGPVVGNGVSLNGYYRITAVDVFPPVAPQLNPTIFTISVSPQVALAAGVITTTARLRGYQGTPTYCDFESLTFDGCAALGRDLVSVNGNACRVSGVTVTANYNGAATPQYRAIVGIDDAPALVGVTPVASYVSGVIGALGTVALQAGWLGNNKVTWGPTTATPVVV